MIVGIDRGSDRRFRDHARDLDLQFRAFRKEMPRHDERGVAAGNDRAVGKALRTSGAAMVTYTPSATRVTCAKGRSISGIELS